MSAADHRSEAPATRFLTGSIGNIRRATTAEVALVEAAESAGLTWEVASAGTGDWHLGRPPHAPMSAAASDVGLHLRGTAQQVDPELLAWADLVLVMDRQNLADVERMAAAADVVTPVRLFRQFDPELHDTPEGPSERTRNHGPDEVPDPYGGAPEGFEEVVRICRRTAQNIVASWPAPEVTR